jgi:hypothetical protein
MAEELYPHEGDSIRKKRVRARINDARKRVVNNQGKKELAKSTMIKGTPYLHVQTFFEWACLEKGWEALKTIPGLPAINAKVDVAGVAATGEVDNVYEASDQDAEIRALKAKIKQLEEWKQKRVAKSKRASEAGKLGGRPKNSPR